MYIVVGRPIEIEKNPEPTMEQVKHLFTHLFNSLKFISKLSGKG